MAFKLTSAFAGGWGLKYSPSLLSNLIFSMDYSPQITTTKFLLRVTQMPVIK